MARDELGNLIDPIEDGSLQPVRQFRVNVHFGMLFEILDRTG